MSLLSDNHWSVTASLNVINGLSCFYILHASEILLDRVYAKHWYNFYFKSNMILSVEIF